MVFLLANSCGIAWGFLGLTEDSTNVANAGQSREAEEDFLPSQDRCFFFVVTLGVLTVVVKAGLD